MNPNSQNDIRTKDVMTMAFLKIKYWGLFRDIEANRDLYTQIRLEDQHASLLFDSSDDKNNREKHFNNLFERLGYDSNDIQLLKPLLSETFPDWQGKGYTSEDELLSTNRIGHRDLLDLYFSYGISHRTFKERMEHVRPIIERVAKGKYSEKSLTKSFREFNHYALSNEQGGDIARLLARRLLSLQNQQTVPVVVWRCWLRALLRYESGSDEATNAILASILSGANECIQRPFSRNNQNLSNSASVIDRRVGDAMTLFEDITTYLSNPYTGLLLLLFVFPPRGNSFFPDYINQHGTQDLYLPILDYVDDYFIAQKRNVFHEYGDSRHWRFVLYQWSLSISQSGNINSLIEDAENRRRAVNDYVFSLLKNNPKLTYEFILAQFLTDGDQGTSKREWHIGHELNQYSDEEDRARIISLVQDALSSKVLNASQKEELVEFSSRLNELIATEPL